MSASAERTSSKTPAVRIQAATAADIRAMLRVINTAFEVETFLDGTRTNDGQLRLMMDKGTFLLARQADEQIVASIYTELRGDRGYFGMLAVDPSRQGIGLGRVMVDAAEDRLRRNGCSYVDISVLSLRTELFPFYRKLGYAESGVAPYHTPHLLRPGIVCEQILMSKALSR